MPRLFTSKPETIRWQRGLPDADMTVLVYVPKATEPVWLGYFDGHDWRYVSAEVIDVPVKAWAHVPEGSSGGKP